MTSKTRKHIWPVGLMSLAVFGVLAAVVALSVMAPRTSLAHGCDDIANPVERAQCITDHVAAGIDDPSEDHSHDDGDGSNGLPPISPAASDMIASSSTSGGASVKLTLTLDEPGALQAGSSVVLYLEDDFQVGDIDMSRVYFVGRTTGRGLRDRLGSG